MPDPRSLDRLEGSVVFHPAFFAPDEADRLIREIRNTTAWRQEAIRLYGRAVPLPRLTAWHGDEGRGTPTPGSRTSPPRGRPPFWR